MRFAVEFQLVTEARYERQGSGPRWFFQQSWYTGWFALLVLWPSITRAQTLSFQPTAGQTYDYGVEYRIIELTEENRQPVQVRQRCRLRFVVTETSPTGWTARYMTIPFLGSAPAHSKESYQRYLERTKTPLERPSSEFRPPPTGIPSHDQHMNRVRERAAAFRKELNRRRVVELDYYQGLFRFCEGTFQADSRGRFNSLTGEGTLPFATGHIANLIFLGLPDDGNTTSGFSSKSINQLLLVSLQDEQLVDTTEISVLSIMSPRQASTAGLVAFDRDVEASGGVTAGTKFTLSGKGTWEYSKQLRMPYAGSIDYEIDGFTYFGVGNRFKARIGFHYLHGIRAALFDLDLLPTLDALESENLPEISNKQLGMMQELWSKSADAMRRRGYDRATDLQLQQFALASAPPPSDSTLHYTIDRMIAEEEKVVLREDGSKSSDKSDQIGQLRRIDARWKKLRELARHIPRTWTDDSGALSVSAKLVSVQADSVTLKREDNQQQIVVPFARLSAEDARFARSFGLPAGVTGDSRNSHAR